MNLCPWRRSGKHSICWAFISSLCKSDSIRFYRKSIITLVKLHPVGYFIILLSRPKHEWGLFIVLSKRFPRAPIQFPFCTKIHLTVLRHRFSTPPTHQVVLITAIMRPPVDRAAPWALWETPQCMTWPPLTPSSYTWCDVMQPHSRVGRIIIKTHSGAWVHLHGNVPEWIGGKSLEWDGDYFYFILFISRSLIYWVDFRNRWGRKITDSHAMKEEINKKYNQKLSSG